MIVQPFLAGGSSCSPAPLQDPVFGPLVAFGPGGALAELIGQAASDLPRSTVLDAEELVRDGKAGRLVAGFRGAAPADPVALVDLLLRLGRLAEDLPEVAELDLNPILAGPTAASWSTPACASPPPTRSPASRAGRHTSWTG